MHQIESIRTHWFLFVTAEIDEPAGRWEDAPMVVLGRALLLAAGMPLDVAHNFSQLSRLYSVLQLRVRQTLLRNSSCLCKASDADGTLAGLLAGAVVALAAGGDRRVRAQRVPSPALALADPAAHLTTALIPATPGGVCADDRAATCGRECPRPHLRNAGATPPTLGPAPSISWLISWRWLEPILRRILLADLLSTCFHARSQIVR